MKAKYFFLAVIITLFSNSLMAQHVPQIIYYQGNLADNAGNPVNKNQSMSFSIWENGSKGVKLWEEDHKSVAVREGLFSVLLGSENPLPMEVFSASPRYLEIVIGGETLSPRQRVASVPYAQVAASVSGSSNVFPSSGNVGIGTESPGEKLEVAGVISSKSGGFKFPDGSRQTTATSSSSGNTLDQAYDEGGPGNGKTINADAGPVTILGANGLKVDGTSRFGGKLSAEGGIDAASDISITSNGGAVQIQAGSSTIRISPTGVVTIESNKIELKSSGDLKFTGDDIEIKGNNVSVNAAATLDLKSTISYLQSSGINTITGALVKIN